jgi:hypothetical protein
MDLSFSVLHTQQDGLHYIQNKVVQVQSIHNLKGRTYNVHGDVGVNFVVSGASGGTV